MSAWASAPAGAALVVLASGFAAAGTLKLLTPRRPGSLLDDLGARSPAGALGVALLPYAELALAAMFTAPVLRRPAAIAALLFLAAATVVLASRRARGDQRPCGCFGTDGSPRADLARNAVLIAAAAAAAGTGPSGPPPGTLALATVAGAGVVVSAALARILRTGQRAAGGSAGPRGDDTWLDLTLATTTGTATSVRRWLDARSQLLVVFIDPVCAPCRSLLPELATRQRTSAGAAVGIVSRGPMTENTALARDFGLAPVAVQAGGELALALGITATPAALLVTRPGRVMAGPALGRHAILDLLAAQAPPAPAPPAATDPAPVR